MSDFGPRKERLSRQKAAARLTDIAYAHGRVELGIELSWKEPS
jgi:hypothetical protein